MCYRRGGRRRNAALLRLEVAEALSAAGLTREAVSLLSSLVQEVLHEGWLSIAAALLARLLDCSHPLTAVRKPTGHLAGNRSIVPAALAAVHSVCLVTDDRALT